ncbi:MAG TPA: diguanylate cyclase [Nitrospiria bacterium]|nr:diguanylate cyclase [Nitrospiria bacterium]
MSDKVKAAIARYYRTGLLAILGAVSASGFLERSGLLSLSSLIWLAGWLTVLGSLAIRFMALRPFIRHDNPDRYSQGELSAALVLGVHALTQSTEGIGSPWMLGYVFLLLMAAFFFEVSVNLITVAAILVMEGTSLFGSHIPLRNTALPALIWAAGLAMIPLMVKGYLTALIKEKDFLKETLSRMKTGAQAVTPLPDIHQKEGLHSFDSRERLERMMPLSQRFEEIADNLLWILKSSIRSSRHCLLFLVQRPDHTLCLQQAAGLDLGDLNMNCKILPGRGLIGWIAQERRPVRLGHFEAHREGLIEYLTAPSASGGKVQSILALPLASEEVLEGMVVVDSPKEDAFSEEDEHLLVLVSRQILQALHDLRDRQRMQSKAMEFSTLLDVSRALSSKLDLGHRLETMADKVHQIIPYDHCFVFLVEAGERRARLAVVRGYEQTKLADEPVTLHDGFISLIVKNRQPFLFTDLHERHRRIRLFPSGCHIKLSPASFLGLPMIAQDRIIGIFVISSQQPDAFDGHHKDFLEALCHQAALSVSDAQLHDEVARLATSDGLTGVANHRRFQERLAEECERQTRHQGTFSLIMLDVDHFKRINDSFGHPVGDQVLKRLAGILVSMMRKIDTVARYGGEEFAVLLPNAGRREAAKLADRIRKAVEESRFEIGPTPIPVTVSLGVATFPEDTLLRQELLEAADQALYAAKKAGRNRTCLYSEIR